MEVKLVAFGIAKDILKHTVVNYPLPPAATVLDLKEGLMKQYPGYTELKSLKFAINENYQDDSYALHEGDEVVIIPPVSGG